MKILPIITVLAASGLIVGCNRSDNDRSAADTRDNSVAMSRENTPVVTTNLTPTSRNNDASRTYQGGTGTATQDADNTGRNVRDRSDQTLTSGDQGNSDSDREITRNIRRALMKNNDLSTTAKNIKIITVNGKVTLRGPVASEQEQQQIATAAQAVAGVTALDNQLEVKAK